MTETYNGVEMLIIEAARHLKEKDIVFAGVGLPLLAVAVAKQFYCKELTIVCESGVVDAKPTRLSLSVADPYLARNSAAVLTVNEVFSYILQGGRISVALLGGAQVDRYGNINSTVIGDYVFPNVRLPGSGGACEIAFSAARTIILMPQNVRRFVDNVDFITSSGHLKNLKVRFSRASSRRKGPVAVISDLGVYSFEEESKEMILAKYHKNVDMNYISENTGWPLKVKSDVIETKPPDKEELEYLRQLDPQRIFLGKVN